MALSPESATMVAGGRHGIPWRTAGTVFAALFALGGAGLVGAGLNAPPPRPPQPAAAAAPTNLPVIGELPPSDIPDTGPGPALTRSEPTSVSIPKIAVNAQIMQLGVNPDGTLQVPPLEQAQLAGWYKLGPTPGEPGNAVVVGHVDSQALGPAVFFRLGELLPGDTIQVTRADGTVATFRVDGVKSYPKTDFPSELVYGASDKAGLRLVTCGGQFDEAQRSYLDNVIVFATLTA